MQTRRLCRWLQEVQHPNELVPTHTDDCWPVIREIAAREVILRCKFALVALH